MRAQEILADLNSCLEELQSRAIEIEDRMSRYEEHATQHMRASKARGSQNEAGISRGGSTRWTGARS